MLDTHYIICLPVLFILHDTEEIITYHRWIIAHRQTLIQKFPRLRSMFNYMADFSTSSFIWAALEELLVLLLVTAYFLLDGAYSLQIWSAIFIAFSLHLVLHVGQSCILKGYVPGVISSLLLLPYSVHVVQRVCTRMETWELIAWGLMGLVFIAINLKFAHWLGAKISQARQNR